MIGLARSTLRYQTTPKDDDELRLALLRLAKQYARYGYRKLAQLLRMEGWTVMSAFGERKDYSFPKDIRGANGSITRTVPSFGYDRSIRTTSGALISCMTS